MTSILKPLEDLRPDDFVASPVWQFALDQEGAGETLMRPVTDLPVHDLLTRVVGTRVRFANDDMVWAVLENMDLNSEVHTRHFLSLSLFWDNQWMHLARYHDYGQEQYGPAALAASLGLPITDIFPIAYDVSDCCVGDQDIVRGFIQCDPKDKLTRDQVLDLVSKG